MECPIIPDEFVTKREFPCERLQFIEKINKQTLHSPFNVSYSRNKIDMKSQTYKDKDKYLYLHKIIEKPWSNQSNINYSLKNSNYKIKKNIRKIKNEIIKKSWTFEEIFLRNRQKLKFEKKKCKKSRTPTFENRKILLRHNTAFLTLLQENELRKLCSFQPSIAQPNNNRKCFQEFYQDQLELYNKKNQTLQKIKDKLEEKLKEELTFTPKICNNSKQIFKEISQGTMVNSTDRLYQIKKKNQSFGGENNDNIFPYNKKLKNIYLSNNKVQRSQSLSLKSNNKKKPFLLFELKRKTVDLALYRKRKQSRNYFEALKKEKTCTSKNEKKPIYTLSKSDLYLFSKFKISFENKYKKIVGDINDLNIDIFSIIIQYAC